MNRRHDVLACSLTVREKSNLLNTRAQFDDVLSRSVVRRILCVYFSFRQRYSFDRISIGPLIGVLVKCK